MSYHDSGLPSSLERMIWTRLGDLKPRYNHLTAVAGDLALARAWPGAEAADYPDDEHEVPGGTLAILDLDLLTPTVFAGADAVRLVACLDGRGSANVDEENLRKAVEAEVDAPVMGTFEVTSGALALLSWDWAGKELTLDAVTEPTLVKGAAIVPCSNGKYEVTQRAKVAAKGGAFDQMLQLTVRRAR